MSKRRPQPVVVMHKPSFWHRTGPCAPAHIEAKRPLLIGQPRLGLAIEGGEYEDMNLESTVAKICTYRLHARRHEVRAAYAPGISRASHCWPGGGNSSTAPFAVYGKGLSLNTSDRRASCASDRSSHHQAAMIG